MVNRKQRIRNALWGLFIGDALAMPAHWYYRVENIQRDFNGGVTGYVDPPHPHPEAFMVGMAYRPDVEKAHALDRAFDILHEHARFYNTTYTDRANHRAIDLSEREGAHGNAVAKAEDRYHYHHGLKAGENTVAAHVARVLIRGCATDGRYDPDRFLGGFIEHMTTPGRNRDPYNEIYIRRWFENYSRGFPLHACAEEQRNVWSIGSHGGMIRAMIVSTLFPSAFQGLGFAIEHQQLTHRSENVAAALGCAVPLLHTLLAGADPAAAIAAAIESVPVPKVTGTRLFELYREHHGPGNIPADEMWRLHTELVDEPVEAERLATACYTEHGFPLMLALARDNNAEFKASLLASVNAGGDNVHRTAVLGLLMGAACEEIPEDLIAGLTAADEIRTEIDAFVALAPD